MADDLSQFDGYRPGASGPELRQQRGIWARAVGLIRVTPVTDPRPEQAHGDLPVPLVQRAALGNLTNRMVEARVPSSTAGDLLPNNRRPTEAWDNVDLEGLD